VARATFKLEFCMHSFDFLFPSYKLRSLWPPRLHDSIHVLSKLHSSLYSKWLAVIKIGYVLRLPHYHALGTKLTLMFTSKVPCFQNNYLPLLREHSASIVWCPTRWTSSVLLTPLRHSLPYLQRTPAYTHGPTQHTHEYE